MTANRAGRHGEYVTMRTSLLALALAAASALAASTAAATPRLKVVTTVSPLTNIVANVAGGLVDVEGVVPEGANSHEFEPAPSVARLLAGADLVFANGLQLEQPTLDLARANLKRGARIVELGPRTIAQRDWIYDFSFPRSSGDPNPHLWTDPRYARRYAALVRDALSRRDPRHAPAYARNYRRFAARLDSLDRALRRATATLPGARRKLLTYHDSFAYFARDYGWRVIGAIQPSDFSEPSPKEVARLIGQIREEGVPAIFGSELFPSPVLKQIAKESGTRYVDDLRDDDLPGRPGDAEHSLVALLRFDYTTIVEALGGDAAALRGVGAGNTATDTARYPQ